MNDQLPPEDPDVDRIKSDAGKHETPIAERIVNQRIYHRWIVLGVALLSIVGLGCLEYVLVNQLLKWNLTGADTPLVVLAISPIVAATTVVVFLLLGAFRGFKEFDTENSSVGSIVRGIMEGSHSS